MKDKLLVSISCITYNHEKFIAQAIDSFLMQEKDFDIEIIISDDCSTDNTVAIIKKYQKKYPNIVKLIELKKNIGSQKNFYLNITNCKGKYISICEGDDYWIDKNKLKKQIDFLEKNNDYSLVVNRCIYYYSNSNKFEEQHKELFQNKESIEINLNNYLSPLLIPTNSLTFRNDSFKKNNFKFKKGFKDIVLFSLLLRFGKGVCNKEELSVYRIHDQGIWSSQSEFKKIKSNYETSLLFNHIYKNKIPEISKFSFYTAKKYFELLLEEKNNKIELTKVFITLIIRFHKKYSKWEIKNLTYLYFKFLIGK